MCLVISGMFWYLAYSFYSDGDMVSGAINGTIALFFAILMVRNILKTTKEKQREAKMRVSDYKFDF